MSANRHPFGHLSLEALGGWGGVWFWGRLCLFSPPPLPPLFLGLLMLKLFLWFLCLVFVLFDVFS